MVRPQVPKAKPRATKKVPMPQPWHFPWTAFVLTILCIVCGYFAWQNWVQVAPILPVLGALMGGGEVSPETMAQFQGADPESLVITGIAFIGLFVAFVVFLILAAVGWARDW